MKRQIEVRHLRIGMFVSELDRPWLETPFLFQGFLIETQEELGKLQELCNHVMIDSEKSISEHDLLTAHGSGDADQLVPERLVADYEDVLQATTPIRLGMIKSIDDRRLGKMVRTASLKDSVVGLLDAVLANSSAALWLTKIREADEFTATHSLNVAVIAVAFAHRLGDVDHEELEAIGLGAMLHDIGLTERSSDIVRKKAELTDEEFAAIRQHPLDALRCIEDVDALPRVTTEIIRWHHERLDGSGYPDGLSGTAIPRHVRIVGLADAYDAMASDRIYRKGLQPSDALLELYKDAEHTFGVELVRTFIRCIGIYPPGTVVRLNTGAIGMVVASREEARLLPLVLLLLDPEGRALQPRQMVDLAHLEEKTGKRWTIDTAIDPAQYGIDVSTLLAEE